MIAWLDVQVAAAGDMILGALIDAGAPLDAVRDGLAPLGLGVALMPKEVHRGAFRALHVTVAYLAKAPVVRPGEHVHRPWREVRELLSRLDGRVRDRALAAYGRLADAEAKLHGMPVDDVELHEVGSADAIADIVGACVALEALGVDRIVAPPLPMGTGSVTAAHGALPLPAPATLEVLKGWPVVASPWPGEWVTPTGAALVAALAEPGPMPAMRVRAVGHGAGRRDPPMVANLVRAVLGEAESPSVDAVVELACNVDDMTGQHVAALIERLLADGALDAWATPTVMKKGRPGLVIAALARPADADRLTEALLRHSSTLGVRRSTKARELLDRWFETVDTPWGPVRVKVAGRNGVAWHAQPEFDDVARVAAAAGVPLQDVHTAALRR